MTARDVAEIVGGLAADGITVWVDGGWCVEALVGVELREHGDLDVAFHFGPVSALAEVYLDLAYWNGVNYDENRRKLEVLLGVFGIACASLVAELVVWLVDLGGA